MTLKSKKNDFAIVTGAAGFLGEVHCECVLMNNCNLIMLDINNKKLNFLSKKLKKIFPLLQVEKYRIDITNLKKIQSLKKKFFREKKFIKVLINNACVDPKPSNYKNNNQAYTLKSWNREIDVGLKGSFLIIENFVDGMIKFKKGSIINIASDLSVIAPNQSIYKNVYKNFEKPVTYSVIKHGLIGMTKYYAAKFAKFNITCNAISPVGVQNNQNKKFVKNLINLIPMRRMATKEDIKHVISFLLSEKQRFITGQNIIIDGGRTII